MWRTNVLGHQDEAVCLWPPGRGTLQHVSPSEIRLDFLKVVLALAAGRVHTNVDACLDARIAIVVALVPKRSK